MQTAMITDIGHIRSVNEDRYYVNKGTAGITLAIVADGMGGHQAGEVASQTAVEVIHTHLEPYVNGTLEDDCATLIKEAVHMANEKVHSLALSQASFQGMGTTIVVAVVKADQLIVGHIGDSRAYVWNGDRLEQLTNDHSLVNELLKSGQISEEEAKEHPRRNVLTRALGTEPFVEVDVYSHDWTAELLLLLCTDGLTNYVDRKRIESVLSADDTLEHKAQTLVSAALDAGGDDNITVVLLHNKAAAD